MGTSWSGGSKQRMGVLRDTFTGNLMDVHEFYVRLDNTDDVRRHIETLRRDAGFECIYLDTVPEQIGTWPKYCLEYRFRASEQAMRTLIALEPTWLLSVGPLPSPPRRQTHDQE